MNPTATAATVVAAVSTGLTAGVYLAFSVLVMPALADVPPAPAVAAMIGSLPDWQFVPAMRSGVPQRSWVSVPYRLQ